MTSARSRAHLGPLAVLLAGAVVCGLGLWLSWGVFPWILGAVLLGAGTFRLLPATAIRWLAAGVTVVVAAVPFVLPVLSPSVAVAWSVRGERAVTASDEVLLTLGRGDDSGIDDGAMMLRGRTAGSGDLLWEREVDAHSYEEAWVHHGADIAVVRVETESSRSWELRALNVTTGEQLWTSAVDEGAHPVAASAGSLVIDHGRTTAAVDATTGEQLWSVPGEPALVRSEPGVLPEVAYLGLHPPEDDDQPDEVVIGIHDAATGEQSGEVTVAPQVLTAVVGDELVTDDTRALRQTDPEHPDFYRATIRGLSLPDGAEQWSVELLRPTFFTVDRDRWVLAAFGSTVTSASEGEQTYTIAPDGTLEVVSLHDGSVAQIAAPPGVTFRLDRADALPTWAAHGQAVIPDAGSRYGGMATHPVYAAWVDVATGEAETVRAPDSPPAATVPGTSDESASPLWVKDRWDVFGRVRPHALTIVDTGASPELRDLGGMPGGAGLVDSYGDLLIAQTSDELYVLDQEGLR